jgi:hypothetical protein
VLFTILARAPISPDLVISKSMKLKCEQLIQIFEKGFLTILHVQKKKVKGLRRDQSQLDTYEQIKLEKRMRKRA